MPRQSFSQTAFVSFYMLQRPIWPIVETTSTLVHVTIPEVKMEAEFTQNVYSKTLVPSTVISLRHYVRGLEKTHDTVTVVNCYVCWS